MKYNNCLVTTVLRIHFMRIRIQVMNISLRILRILKYFFSLAYKFLIISLLSQFRFVFWEQNISILQFFVNIILTHGSAYFSGSGSRKQNVTDPTDPDPKHCFKVETFCPVLTREYNCMYLYKLYNIALCWIICTCINYIILPCAELYVLVWII